MIVLQVIFLAIVLRLIYNFTNYERLKKIKNFKLFDDGSLPLFGDIFRCVSRSTNDIYQFIMDLSANVSDTRIIWIFYRFIVVLGNPEDIKTVLNTQYAFEKGTPFCVMGGTRYALLTAFSNYWKPLRRKLNSVISISSLKLYFTNFNACAKLLINDLDQYVDKEEFDISKLIGIATTNAALRSHLNIEIDDNNQLYKHYIMLETILAVNGSRLFQFYYQVIIMWFRTKIKMDALDMKLFKELVKFWKPYIATISDNLDAHQNENNNVENNNNEKPDYFMKRLIRLYQAGVIVKHALYENLVYFIAAASNTGSITISIACLLMAFYPEVAEKLYAEINQYVVNGDEIDYETLGKMEYLDRVMKEILRLYPAVPMISRKIMGDVHIKNGTIPAGSDILIPIRSVHRNKEIWGLNAEKFDPDNFLPERVAQRSICAYIPFAYGLRNCMGYKYATNLNKLLLARLVKRYTFSTQLKENELKFGFAITSKLLGEHKVRITRRR